MPIDYKRYPKNWKTEIRPRILKRADDKCEFCDVENYEIIRRYKSNTAWFIYENTLNKLPNNKTISKYYHKPIKIILTIAHLDQDISNNADENLKALCQRCHLNHDRKKITKG
jgi:hypothetical protein